MRTEKQKGPGPDFFLRLTALQLALAGVLFALCFGAMKWNPALFEALRAGFASMMEKDLDPGEITLFPPQEAPAVAPADPSETTAETTTETEETAADLPENESAAGGEDLPAGTQTGLVSFGFYDAGEIPVLPVNGTVTSGFGERIHPIYGTQGFHSGRDIAAPEGTPVCAALDGEVIAAGVGEKSGNYVRLRHENGLETLYCHCSRLNVTQGVSVRKGDVIAFVGQTGLATGPHLHFEVRVNGELRDPAYLLTDAVSVS